MITYKVNKSKLSSKPVGCVLGSPNDKGQYKNIVLAYLGGSEPVLIKTNLTQSQFNLFSQGKLSSKELEKYI